MRARNSKAVRDAIVSQEIGSLLSDNIMLKEVLEDRCANAAALLELSIDTRVIVVSGFLEHLDPERRENALSALKVVRNSRRATARQGGTLSNDPERLKIHEQAEGILEGLSKHSAN